ncbi:MAG: FHA domain-containing protein [Silicimonas sp.]
MKILSRMLTRKPQPQQALDKVDLDDDLEPLRRRDGEAEPRGRSRTSTEAEDPPFADRSRPIHSKSDALEPPREPEPEVVGQGWEDADWEDDEWDDDEDWGNEDLDANDPARDLKATQDKAHLVSEIREAMGSVSHVQPDAPKGDAKDGDGFRNRWSDDEEFGRRAIARSQLTSTDAEDRILEKTETVMTDRETSRRRSAMAHLKAAAAATKADRVLKHVVSRDPSADPEEQSPYRDDLAKVVRPHRPSSRPISRQVTQEESRRAIWDQGEGDEDAALYAASTDEDTTDSAIEAELAAAEAERLARAPIELSEEEFEDDSVFGGDFEDDDDDGVDFPNSPFAGGVAEPEESEMEDHEVKAEDEVNAFDPTVEFGADEFDEDFDEEDDFAPRPSRVVSEAVAFANAPDEEVNLEPDESEVRRKIWEMTDEVASEVQRNRSTLIEPVVDVAPVVAGRAGRSAGRVKTRMLGFQPDAQGPKDVFEESAEKAAASKATHFPAGWIVVVEGPGRGACFTLHNGVSQIGRGEEQAVRLDFGDTSISRNNHAAVAYDDEQGKFFLGHGGKSNLVRLNGRPVLSTEEMSNGDQIRIGETTLKFVALCGEEFTWKSTEGADNANA